MFWSNCMDCPLKGKKPVMASMPTKPKIAIIGEAPGEREDREGKPFIGRAGQLLDELLEKVGLDRERDAFIANTVMCRPPKNKIGNEEIKHCFPILEGLLSSLSVKVIVPMGNTALGRLMGYGGSKKAGITKHRGQLVETPYGMILPTFHPAYALRNEAHIPVIENDLKLAVDYISGKFQQTKPDYIILQDYKQAMDVLERLRTAKAWAYDTETTGFLKTDRMVGISFSMAPGHAYYLPSWVFDEGTEELVRPKMIQYWPFRRRMYAKLVEVFDSDARKAGHNLKFDSQVIHRNVGVWPKNQVFDTMLAAHTLDSEAGGFSLDLLTGRHVPEMAGYKNVIKEFIGSGSKLEEDYGFGMIPLEALGPYACGDADATLRLAVKLKERLQAKPKMQRLFDNLIMPFMEELARAEDTGVKLNLDYLQTIQGEFSADIGDLQYKIMAMAEAMGLPDFNPNSGKQMQEFVYKRLGCTPPQVRDRDTGKWVEKRTPAGNLPTDKYSFISVILDSRTSNRGRDTLNNILEHNKVKKLNSTYVEGMLAKQQEGILHPSFLQHGTKTGRLSCTKPNLQNIPRDTEANKWAGAIKRMFVPRDGYVFVESDLSQIELRVLAYYTMDPVMLEAYTKAGADLHAGTASSVFKIPVEDVTYDQRSIGKTINFSVAYLAGPMTLYQTIVFGDPRPERVAEMMKQYTVRDCKRYIEEYFNRHTAVRPWMDESIAFARRYGFVETYWGRERRITGINSDDGGERRHAENQAVNTRIQGSACDITNRAFMRCGQELDARIARPLLHIHDQVVVEAKEKHAEAVAEQLIEIMTDPCGKIGTVVPIKAEYSIIDRLGGEPIAEG